MFAVEQRLLRLHISGRHCSALKPGLPRGKRTSILDTWSRMMAEFTRRPGYGATLVIRLGLKHSSSWQTPNSAA